MSQWPDSRMNAVLGLAAAIAPAKSKPVKPRVPPHAPLPRMVAGAPAGILRHGTGAVLELC